MKRKRYRYIIIIVAIILLIGVCYGEYQWYKASISENHYVGKTTEEDIKVSFQRYEKADKFLKDVPEYVTLMDGKKLFKEEEENGHGFILGQVKMDTQTYEKSAEYKMYLIQKNGNEQAVPLLFTTVFNDLAEGDKIVKADFYFTEQKSSLYTAVRMERNGKEVMAIELKTVE